MLLFLREIEASFVLFHPSEVLISFLQAVSEKQAKVKGKLHLDGIST
jgi:hypothetical protein